jgi:uncharacterized lipoprotein YmbA
MRPRAIVLLAAVAALAACASSEPPPLLLTVPSSAMQAVPPAAPPAAARTLVLRRVGLPEYLLSRRVRYRDSASSLADWPDAYWAERIEIGVGREMAQALRARLPGWTLCEGSCTDGTAGDLVLRIDFHALDFVRGGAGAGPGRLLVSADTSGGSATATRWRAEQRFTLDVPVASPRAHADAVGTAVQRVADELAARVRQP